MRIYSRNYYKLWLRMQYGAFKKWLRRKLGLPYKPKIGEKCVALMWVPDEVLLDDDADGILESFSVVNKPEGCVLTSIDKTLHYLDDEPNVRFIYKYVTKGWMNVGCGWYTPVMNFEVSL